MQTKVLLFDLGGVLIENSTFEELAILTSGSIAEEELRERWLASPSVRRYERGEIETQNFCHSFVQEWELDITPAQFAERFSGFPKGPFRGVEALLNTLRARYRIAFLSNCNDLHWKRLAYVLDWADYAFSSHLIEAVKPDRASFEYVARTFDVDFEEIVFFDDSTTNVRAASDLGIRAYRTDGFDQLMDVIKALQL